MIGPQALESGFAIVWTGFTVGVAVWFVTWCIKGAGHLTRVFNPFRD